VEPEAFTLDLSFRILFMVIIGGLGSILGSFLGAAFITLLPILLNIFVPAFNGLLQSTFHWSVPTSVTSNLELMVFGGLIIFFDRRTAWPRAAGRSGGEITAQPFPH
jgi:branched-chain amino acid transport system permease protein